jgi:putative ABC transport system permease protein
VTGHGEALQDIAALEKRLGTADAPQAPADAQPAEVAPAGADPELVQLALPEEQWKVSAVLVKARAPTLVQAVMWTVNNGSRDAMAANPAVEMIQFFSRFLEPYLLVLFYITVLVTAVAGISILVSIYNSVSARIREIAILRALGATRRRILLLICLEAGLIGLIGGLLGLLVAHAVIGAMASAYLRATVGQGINWYTPSPYEGLYLLGVVVVAVLAGLVPALKAYRTPVATNLTAA